jgi:putative phosphoribosyl transferase
MGPPFRDRADAGRRLAERLTGLGLTDPLVLALPRGGVPVAAPVAAALGGTVVPFVARKVTTPERPEYGIGAVAEGGADVLVSEQAADLGLSRPDVERLAEAELAEVARRAERYRDGRPLPAVPGHEVVLVDDGLATGVTAEAALLTLRRQHPSRLVLAVPVGAPDTVARLGPLAEVVCLETPAGFGAVGHWYRHFDQTSDEEVVAILRAQPGRVADGSGVPGRE